MDPTLVHLLNALPEPSFLLGASGTVREANAAAARLSGRARESLCGACFPSLVTDGPERTREYLRMCARSRQPVPGSFGWTDEAGQAVQLRCDGMVLLPREEDREALLFLRCRPRVDAGDPFVLLNQKIEALTREIIERKKIQRQRDELLESEREARLTAERASRMKDEFLATLSHELRTPLSAIMGWAHLLEHPHEPELVAEGIGVIARNARVQGQLINDLLDMSHIVSGKVRLQVQRVDLPALIEAAVQSVRPAADARAIRVQVTCDPLAGPVKGDPDRLQQILWNLLNNAVKFTPKGGRVQVLLERVNSHIEITVSDTGEGIRPEFLPFVFDRFRQADASTTRRHGGLGLGLAIVKQLVEIHGGSVHAKSRGEGQGSTFIVALPLLIHHDAPGGVPPRTDAPPADRAPDVDLSGVDALVIDDEPDARELIRRILVQLGAGVRAVSSGREALAAIAERTPDLIVSDIGMVGMDGYELMRHVRALPENAGGRTPAMALSAFARAEDRTRSMQAGFNVHLSKPLDYAEFVATAGNLTGRITPV